jgi:integrase
LAKGSPPLRDFAILSLDTGLRDGEALSLEWKDVHLEPMGSGSEFGYVKIRHGKSKYACRNVPLTERARRTLKDRNTLCHSLWAFTQNAERPMLVASMDHAHAKTRKAPNMPPDFVLHSLKHTYGTRLGEAGTDAFTILRLMGHSSVTVSQRYVHPTPEAIERATEQLEALNTAAMKALPAGQVPEISTVVQKANSVSH